MAKMSIEEMKWVLKKVFDYSKRIQEKRNRVGEMTQLENKEQGFILKTILPKIRLNTNEFLKMNKRQRLSNWILTKDNSMLSKRDIINKNERSVENNV